MGKCLQNGFDFADAGSTHDNLFRFFRFRPGLTFTSNEWDRTENFTPLQDCLHSTK